MALAALLPACGFGASSNSDGGHDAPPDAQQCFGTFVRVCFASAAAVPTAPRMLDTIDIDTDAGPECNQDNDQTAHYCVVAGAGLTVLAGKKVTAHGGKPLLLLSTMTMDVLGDVDVSSHATGPQAHGAGANPAAPACSFATAPMQPLLGGGAYGGSLGSKGGSGSQASPAGTSMIGVPGSEAPMFPVPLRGGCKGGDGAVPGVGTDEGHGGDGGGAVGFLAIDQIRINSARINASGAGGHGGPIAAGLSGGGGGGSGGMIYFDSPKDLLFEGAVRLWANGGSGGQGGSGTQAGDNGNESMGPMQFAQGTNGPGNAGNGGTGSQGSGVGGDGQTSTGGGGGGGGGGAGAIHAPGLAGASAISPPSTSIAPSA